MKIYCLLLLCAITRASNEDDSSQGTSDFGSNIKYWNPWRVNEAEAEAHERRQPKYDEVSEELSENEVVDVKPLAKSNSTGRFVQSDQDAPTESEEIRDDRNDRVIKPWARYDPGKRFFRRRIQNRRQLRRDKSDSKQGIIQDTMHNEQLSYIEMKQKLILHASQTGNHDEVAAFFRMREELRKKHDEERKAAVEELPDLFEKIQKLRNDEFMPRIDKRTLINRMIEESMPYTEKMLFELFPQFKNHRRYPRSIRQEKYEHRGRGPWKENKDHRFENRHHPGRNHQ